jgi:hypothetical protein
MTKMKETLIACYAVLNDKTIESFDRVSICIELMDEILSKKTRDEAIKNMEDNREEDLWGENLWDDIPEEEIEL